MSQKQYAAFAANIKSWDALRQKKTNFVPGVLRVEKVILLSKSDFDKLSEDISPDYPFLQDNRHLLSADPGGLFRCLMVRAEGQAEHPQYYIKDNHPAIIPREMFYQIQEEIARRKSKKPANAKKAKTNRGRFTSKYALSERLVCGNCGCYFRRVTWSIHGRKQIVWRCINRLECGPKVCKDSPSLKEDELYSAILKAIRSLVQGHQEEMAATLQEALIHCIDGENAAINPLVIENRLHDLDKDLDRLLTMEGSEIVDLRIKQISDEMLQLRQMKKRAELDTQQDMGRENKAKEIMALISAEDLDLTEYSDPLVYRVIERVTVLSKEEIRIRFVGGFELTQPLH